MKAGEIVTFAHVEGETVNKIPPRRPVGREARLVEEVDALQHFGTHSDEDYAKSDGSKPVLDGRAEYVVVCKVVAVVRRGVQVDE